MKKLITAIILGLSVTAASALEIGVSAPHDYLGRGTTGARISLGSPISLPGLGAATFGFEATQIGEHNKGYTTYAAALQKNVVKLGPVDLGARVSGGRLNPAGATSGNFVAAGLVATLPITKNLSAVGMMERRYGGNDVKAFDGNTAALGLKYSF